MNKFALLSFFLLASTSQAHDQTIGRKSALVYVDFNYHSFPGKVETYEVQDDSKYDIGETRNVDKKDKIPLTKKLTTPFSLKPGQSKTFVLVVENKSNNDWYFNAAPHSITPAESSLGQKFECLCNHSIYRADKKSFWYRIVRFELEKDFTGSSIRLSHSIIGLDEKDAKGKYNEMLYK